MAKLNPVFSGIRVDEGIENAASVKGVASKTLLLLVVAALSAIFSTRFVFSKSGDFDIINELLKADNTIFDRPNISLSWNGQTYYPQGK